MKKATPRKFEDTSWLAQSIKDKMSVEFDKIGGSHRWHCLHTLRIIVTAADDTENQNIYYDTYNGKRAITICKIPSLMEYGTD